MTHQMERSIFVLMNASVKIAESGPVVPHVLDGIPFAADFRYWTGGSGKSYLTRGFPIDMASDFAGAPVILAAVDEDGRREAVWIGLAVGRRFEAGLAAAKAAGATEAHVHLLAVGAEARTAVLRDLRRALGAAPKRASAESGASAGHRDLAA
ncbi:hypothetical protein [Microbaculum marinum]|uniref:Uncharacterized protein n=1 Tax=Microbaculum marinum TaxID=1764581 RepID=A0AAW9RP62_9HYPH